MPFLGVASPKSLMDKTQLFYDDRTREQARTIMFLHDWALNRQEWAYPLAMFSRGYRTIAVDLPGFGRSDDRGGLTSYEGLARDVGALTEVLGLDQLVVVGAGMGAAVALEYATRFPRAVAGLVLVGAIAPRWTVAPDFPIGVPRSVVESLLERSETAWPDLLIDYAQSLFHRAVGEPTRQWFVSQGLAASLYAAQQALICMRDADQRDRLGEIKVPTAIFHGVHDAIAPLAFGEYLAQQIPGAALQRFEQSGHAVWIDEAFRFSTLLTGFVEERVFGNTLPPPVVEQLPGGGERLSPEEISPLPRKGPPKIEGATGQVYE